MRQTSHLGLLLILSNTRNVLYWKIKCCVPYWVNKGHGLICNVGSLVRLLGCENNMMANKIKPVSKEIAQKLKVSVMGLAVWGCRSMTLLPWLWRLSRSWKRSSNASLFMKHKRLWRYTCEKLYSQVSDNEDNLNSTVYHGPGGIHVWAAKGQSEISQILLPEIFLKADMACFCCCLIWLFTVLLG